MKAKITSFRRAKHEAYDRQMLVEVEGIDSKEKAEKIIGKKVTWTSPAKKEIVGVVSRVHGGKGLVSVVFEKGMPGQAVNTAVKVE